MGLQRSRDSAIVQLLLALENASVAAVKIETSVDSETVGDWGMFIGSSVLGVVGDDLFRPTEAMIGVGSGFGEAGRVGGVLRSSEIVKGSVSFFGGNDSCFARINFCNPFRLGTRKL